MSANAINVVFWDDERGRQDRYDFAALGLPPRITRSFATAFKTITGAYRASSRQQAWFKLRRFARFLTHESPDALSDPNVMLTYKKALHRDRTELKAARSGYNFARRLLRWLVENEKDGPWRSAILFKGASTFVRESGGKTGETEISPQLLHRIAAACKREVDQVIGRFGVRERVLRGEEVSAAELGGLRLDLFRQVLALEAQHVYTQDDFRRIHRGGLQRIGLHRAALYRALTNRTALPYYILLIINTCGNPVGIMNLRMDCLQSHPADPLKRRIYWDKYRSHREQAYDVLAEGRYSACRCVSDLLRLTAPIRVLASPADVRKLMLTRSRGHQAKRLSASSLHRVLAVFRTEHSFPYFTFADLRKAAATAVDHYAKSGRAVKKVLQHRSLRTSRVYLQTQRSVDRRYESVLRFQGQMVAAANDPAARSGKASEHRAFDTLAGMRCRDPFSGVAPGSVKNQPCLQWLECCRCPNAIVVRDDPAMIARIIKAAQSLREVRAQAAASSEATQHYESAFRPTLEVIESQILPRIAKRVRVAAETLAASLPALPLLE